MPVPHVVVDDRFLNVREAGKIIDASYAATKRLIASGELFSVKRGRRRLVPYSATQSYIRRLIEAA